MLSTRDPSQSKGHIQTESKGLEKSISHKQRPDERRKQESQYLYQINRLQIKAVKRNKDGHCIIIK